MRHRFSLLRRGDLTFLAHRPAVRRTVEVWCTTRPGGVSRGALESLNLGNGGLDEAGALAANRKRVLEALRLTGVFLPRQVHGSVVLTAGKTPEGFVFGPEGDAVIVRGRGTAVGVLTADCLPVLLYHRREPVVAAVHAGWRGIAAGVVGAALERFLDLADGDPAEVGAYLGPAIGSCCYEVGGEVAEAVARASGETAVTRGPGRPRVDLAGAAAIQLARLGVPPGEVISASLCTCCNPGLFFSYRRDGESTGRMASLVVAR